MTGLPVPDGRILPDGSLALAFGDGVVVNVRGSEIVARLGEHTFHLPGKPTREGIREARVTVRGIARRFARLEKSKNLAQCRRWTPQDPPPPKPLPATRKARAILDTEIESQSETHASPEWDGEGL